MKYLTYKPNECDPFTIDKYTVKSVSFYNRGLINTEVPEYQQKVFDKFNMPHVQFYGDVIHSDFMDYIMKYEECDIYVFFDIDCIPLKVGLYEYIVSKIYDGGIIGIEQCAGIANTSVTHIYAGPSCFGISRKTYEELNKPSFHTNTRSDVAQEFTHLCEQRNIPVYFFQHTESKNYKWQLGENRRFGNATQYEDWLYHQFEIKRDGDNDQNIIEFINKCKTIL